MSFDLNVFLTYSFPDIFMLLGLDPAEVVTLPTGMPKEGQYREFQENEMGAWRMSGPPKIMVEQQGVGEVAHGGSTFCALTDTGTEADRRIAYTKATRNERTSTVAARSRADMRRTRNTRALGTLNPILKECTRATRMDMKLTLK